MSTTLECRDPLGDRSNPMTTCVLTKGHQWLHTDGDNWWAGNNEIGGDRDSYGVDGNMPEHCLRMRAASGRIDSRRKLVSFLYILARDHMTVGAIEGLWINHVEPDRGKSMFTNGWLAQWADDLADRLEGLTADE